MEDVFQQLKPSQGIQTYLSASGRKFGKLDGDHINLLISSFPRVLIGREGGCDGDARHRNCHPEQAHDHLTFMGIGATKPPFLEGA